MEKTDPVPASISSQVTETVYLNQIDESQYKSYYPIDLILKRSILIIRSSIL